MNFTEILKPVIRAYSEDEIIADYIYEPSKNHGDKLAEFIVVEARTLFVPDASPRENVADLIEGMSVAVNQLNSVIEALRNHPCMLEEKERTDGESEVSS